MYPPHLLTLAVILLVSSSTFASPAQSSSPSTSTSSITGHSATSYPHDHDHPYSANLHPAESEDTGCRFIAHGRAYDLCALLYLDTIAKAGSIFNGKGKEKARERDIAVVLAGVRKFRFGPCPKGARTCFIEREGSLRAASVEKSMKKGSSVPPISVGNFRNTGRKFDLWINIEGTRARIILTCASNEELEYKETLDNLRVMNWRTPHACPLRSAGKFIAAEADDENSPPDGEPGVESPEEELKQGELPVGGLSRKWLGFMVLLVACILIITSVFISSPQARHYVLAYIQSAGYAILPLLTNLKQLARPVAKHFPNFKVGERKLIQWAQEDMTLDGDEDFMVNGPSAVPDGWNNLGVMDEYIPLKSSPVRYAHSRTTTMSSQVSASWNYSTYGSVPFEGLDVDESEVDMGPHSEGGMKRLIRSASETVTARVKQLFRH